MILYMVVDYPIDGLVQERHNFITYVFLEIIFEIISTEPDCFDISRALKFNNLLAKYMAEGPVWVLFFS